MKKLVFISFILRGTILLAQNAAADPTPFAATINVADLRAHESVLTADSLEGRETGTVGNLKAAQYIARYFEKLGLPKVGDNGYFQRMVYTNDGWNSLGMTINDHSYRAQFNFYALPATNALLADGKITASEILFLGYGIDDRRYSDYRKADVKGKIILINLGEPMDKDSISVISKSKTPSDWTTDPKRKLATAFQKGVRAVLFIDPKLSEDMQINRNQYTRSIVGDVELPDGKLCNNLFISPDMTKEIIGQNTEGYAAARQKCAEGKPRNLTLPCQLTVSMNKFFKQLTGNNVLAYIEGSDPILKNQLVVVSAHYDHLGMRGKEIYHGADDNASGSSSVLEIVEALVEAKKQGKQPRRSILCLLMTGEEKGLLGSKYYVNHPVFPLENTVADVNIDMVGRVDAKHKDDPNYIYVIGADKLSSDLDKINTEQNAKYTQLALDYTYNDENDPNRYYYRSDHYNFAERGVPAIFYFNGTHEDYHRPTDTMDKINFEKMTTIARLAFFTAWEIANRDERLKIDKVKK